jgi:hypothetical protein
MTTIASSVRRLKSHLPDLIAPTVIEALLQRLPGTFRHRILTPVLVVQLLVLRILEGNTAYTHLPHLAGIAFTASAFCQALARLSLDLLQALLAEVARQVDRDAPVQAALFGGHRVLVVDAACVSMPDTPALADRYGYGTGQKPGLGFPVAKLLLLLDLSSGLIRKVLIHANRVHEMSQTRRLHPELQPGDILLGDRAFASFVHLAMLMAQSCHGLFRLHQKLSWKRPPHASSKGRPRRRYRRMQGRVVKSLGHGDRLILYHKPQARPQWLDEAAFAVLPAEILVRELRYAVCEKGFRSRQVMLVTTLLDPRRYPHDELARLYGLRWQIETQFRHLKSTLNMDVLKGQSVAIIEREILGYVLVYNLLAREIRHAAAAGGVTPDRVSFIDAVRWMLAGMNAALRLVLNPRRPGRVEPRVRKRRPVGYPYMTRPRDVLRQELRHVRPALVRLT